MTSARPSREPLVVGADGAPKGRWAVWTRRGLEEPQFAVAASTAGLVAMAAEARRVALDVPIGLVEEGWREVDVSAKRAMGRHHSRVFMTPPRRVLACVAYAEANVMCRALTGSGLSKQVWNIGRRIMEVDAAMAGRAGVFECHPELVFMGLAGAVVAESKKTAAGVSRRVELLVAAMPELSRALETAIAETPRSVARVDDIVDAAACLVAASR